MACSISLSVVQVVVTAATVHINTLYELGSSRLAAYCLEYDMTVIWFYRWLALH